MSLLQEAETIIQKIKQQQYADLLSHDQLLMERREQKVFLHFGENHRCFLMGPSLHRPVSLFPKHPHCGGESDTWKREKLAQM